LSVPPFIRDIPRSRILLRFFGRWVPAGAARHK
jgi:hypothetical protein